MSNLYYSKLTQKYYKSQQFNNFKYIFKKTYKKSTDLQIPFISHKLKQKQKKYLLGSCWHGHQISLYIYIYVTNGKVSIKETTYIIYK